MMRYVVCCCLLFFMAAGPGLTQQLHSAPFNQSDSIPETWERRVRTIMETLAGDSLEGRGNGQPGLLKAARYLDRQFDSLGLIPLTGEAFFSVPFSRTGSVALPRLDQLTLNGASLSSRYFHFFHRAPGAYTPLQLTDFEVRQATTAEPDLMREAAGEGRPLLILVTSDGRRRIRTDRLRYDLPPGGLRRDVLLVSVTPDQAAQVHSLELRAIPAAYNQVLYNICGMIRGQTSQARMISAHYDHLGTGDPAGLDPIYNGANDNASGTTAMLMIAAVMSARPKPARTVVFAAFAGEEIGLLGSEMLARKAASLQLEGQMNLEMLAIPQFGRLSLLITGERFSSTPDTWKKLMEPSGLRFVRDPDPERMLYERSDNFPFAQRGIPAHTIMGSTDSDPCYHRPCDETGRADLRNLARLSIALAKAATQWVDQ